MIERLRKIILIILCGFICFFVIYYIVAMKFIIKGFSAVYILLGIVISVAGLLLLHVITKLSQNRKIMMILSMILIMLVSFFTCFVIKGINEQLVSDEKYYNLTIEGVPDEYNIILYEYNAFRANSGCLCFKVNNIIYEKIPDTSYSIESGYSLADPGNLILDYVSETETLTMKYRWKENSEYTEKSISLVP